MPDNHPGILNRTDLKIQSFTEIGYRGPYTVDFQHIGVPIEECVYVTQGPVSAEIIESLRVLGYDHAPAVVDHAPIPFRVISRETLVRLQAADAVLSNDPDHFESGDLLQVPSVHIPIVILFEGLRVRRAVMVYSYQEYHREKITLDGGLHVPESSGSIINVLGLVTIADLNRREIRKAAYELLLDLEIALASLVKMQYADSWDWLRHLGEHAQIRLLGQRELMRRREIEMEAIEGLMLNELLNVIGKSEQMRNVLGFTSENERQSTCHAIADLRNRIMHPVRPLILNNADVVRMHRAISASMSICERLERVVEQ